jgi:hypothetical protein
MTTQIENSAIARALLASLGLPPLDHLLKDVDCSVVKLSDGRKSELRLPYAFDYALVTPIYAQGKQVGDMYITSACPKNGWRKNWFVDEGRFGVCGNFAKVDQKYDSVILCETLFLALRIKLLLRSVATEHPPVIYMLGSAVPVEVQNTRKLFYVYEGKSPKKRRLFHIRYHLRRMEKDNRRSFRFDPSDDSTQLYRKLLGKERIGVSRCYTARTSEYATARWSVQRKKQLEHDMCLFSEFPSDFMDLPVDAKRRRLK